MWRGAPGVIDCYEHLRADVLQEARGVQQSLGWSHFVRHGMTAWIDAMMRAQASALPCPPCVETSARQSSAYVVSVLTGMVLGCLAEVA